MRQHRREHHDRSGNAGIAQFAAFRHTGHSVRRGRFRLERLGDLDRSEAVGIALDHRKQRDRRATREEAIILPHGGEVHGEHGAHGTGVGGSGGHSQGSYREQS